MTLALLHSLITNRGYKRDEIIKAYMEWANSGGWCIGKNTAKIFKGVRTLSGYNNRIQKIAYSLPTSERSQSNGPLMRASPLSLINDINIVYEDVNLSNPHPVCCDAVFIYVLALRHALMGHKSGDILLFVKQHIQTNEVREVIGQAERKEFRDIVRNKGWCLHALWCAFITILCFDDYEKAIHWIITSQPGSDTDTNAAIAGALLGAILGYDKLCQSQQTFDNIVILLLTAANYASEPAARPALYTWSNFYELTQAAYELV